MATRKAKKAPATDAQAAAPGDQSGGDFEGVRGALVKKGHEEIPVQCTAKQFQALVVAHGENARLLD